MPRFFFQKKVGAGETQVFSSGGRGCARFFSSGGVNEVGETSFGISFNVPFGPPSRKLSWAQKNAINVGCLFVLGTEKTQ